MNRRNSCRASSSHTSAGATSSTSRRECAGSSDSASEPGQARAAAAAHVVLPAPPLPAKKTNRRLAIGDEGVRLIRGFAGLPFPVLADLAQPAHQHGLALEVLVLADIARLDRHLELEQLVFDGAVVHELLVGDVDHLFEAPP